MSRCRAVLTRSAVLGLLLALVGVSAGTGTAYAKDGIVPGHLPYPRHGTTTVGPGIDADASHAQLAESLPATVRASWAALVPQCTPGGTQPDELVSTSTTGALTIAFDRVGICTYVSAYRTSSGKLVWRKLYLFAKSVATGQHTTYVHWLDVNDRAHVDALRTTTGTRRWRATGAYCCSASNLAVGSGVVVNNGLVLAASDGKRRFQFDSPSDDPQSLVSHGRVYMNSIDYVEAFTPHGRRLWRYAKTSLRGPGDGDEQPQLHDGILYVHSGGSSDGRTLALRASTGSLVRLLPVSTAPLAFDGHVAILGAVTEMGTRGTVSAVDVRTGAAYWALAYGLGPRATGPGVNFSPGAVIANGLLWYIGGTADPSHPTALYALRETTGRTVSVLPTPCLKTGGGGAIGIARHRIFAPTGCGLVTYVGR